MATETDAARDRVLAARAALGDELETLEASARAAVGHPGQDPSAARQGRRRRRAATASSCWAGRSRVFRARRSGRSPGAPEPLPESMLPEEIEKTLR